MDSKKIMDGVGLVATVGGSGLAIYEAIKEFVQGKQLDPETIKLIKEEVTKALSKEDGKTA